MRRLEKLVKRLMNSSIAVVYAYRNESEKGFKHYDYWKMDVLSDWVSAVEELNCIPYILDVRTFGWKAMNGTLPKIDIVINLNAGNYSTSTLGLVPSICGFLAIPCIPCNTVQAVTGEDKYLSNLIAKALKINTPGECSTKDREGIYRPNNLGSSCGVRKNQNVPDNDDRGVFQKFIPGFDLTTPMLYNPLSRQLEVLPPIIYIPDPLNVEWYLGEDEKAMHQGYKKKSVSIDKITTDMFLTMAKSFGIKTFCRIDSRLYCDNEQELPSILKKEISYEKIHFLEINTMPTINEGINFCNAIDAINPASSFGKTLSEYTKQTKRATFVGFILFCSLCSLEDSSC